MQTIHVIEKLNELVYWISNVIHVYKQARLNIVQMHDSKRNVYKIQKS